MAQIVTLNELDKIIYQITGSNYGSHHSIVYSDLKNAENYVSTSQKAAS